MAPGSTPAATAANTPRAGPSQATRPGSPPWPSSAIIHTKKRTAEGDWVSALSAEYPPGLAADIIRIGGYLLTRSGQGEIPLPQPSDRLDHPFDQHRHSDRAGNFSHADWTVPQPNHPLQAVSKASQSTKVQRQLP